MGYSGIITDGKAHHAQLNASPSIPPGSKPIKDLMKAVASPEVGTLKIKISSNKRQASGFKLSNKRSMWDQSLSAKQRASR